MIESFREEFQNETLIRYEIVTCTMSCGKSVFVVFVALATDSVFVKFHPKIPHDIEHVPITKLHAGIYLSNTQPSRQPDIP